MIRPLRSTTLLLLLPALASAAEPGVGLSPVRSVYFENSTFSGNPTEAHERFGWALAAGDFDGDGHEDLAVGAPFDNGPATAPRPGAGLVLVYFGDGASTIDVTTPRELPQTSSGFEALDFHGFALTACDFDTDGFDDLAVGAPGESIGTLTEAGAVFVYPGTDLGPFPGQRQIFTQDVVGIPETAEVGDRLGWSLACGDFDLDGFDDLAIGAPGEALGVSQAGWLVVIPGSATGLIADDAYSFSQLGSGLPSEPETGDEFAVALAAGDLDGDGFDDLAIGARGEDDSAGAAHVLFGGLAGLAPIGSLLITEEALGGLTEAGDRLGSALGFGDFDADGLDDLVVGIPRETFASTGGPIEQTGQVVVVYGTEVMPTLGRIEFWAENNIFGAGTSEAHDRFGEALATGDFDGDGIDDLAVGHPGETPDAFPSAEDGAVTVLGGGGTGLSPTHHRRFITALEGVPGPPPEVSLGLFGWALAAGDFDGDGHDDLAVATPFEVLAGLPGAGAATVLRGALFADGFESDSLLYWRIPVSSLGAPSQAAQR